MLGVAVTATWSPTTGEPTLVTVATTLESFTPPVWPVLTVAGVATTATPEVMPVK